MIGVFFQKLEPLARYKEEDVEKENIYEIRN